MSNENKFTPGPLLITKASLYGYYICDSKGNHIGDVGRGDQSPDEIEANAILWSAAPDLLEALQAFVDQLDGTMFFIERCRFQSVIDKAKAAIQKATGTKQEKDGNKSEGKNLGPCMEKYCSDPAVIDYNGHGHFVCRKCYDRLSDEFDNEYQ